MPRKKYKPEEIVAKLRQVDDYLRNATKEPEKSIPHPFRGKVEQLQEIDELEEKAPSRK
jgi:hypothetical protein